MPRNICLAFDRFGSLFLSTFSASADMGLLFIFARLLLIRQPGNTHGIYLLHPNRKPKETRLLGISHCAHEWCAKLVGEAPG
jgi:hypothetical protein